MEVFTAIERQIIMNQVALMKCRLHDLAGRIDAGAEAEKALLNGNIGASLKLVGEDVLHSAPLIGTRHAA
jgi:hypothetical protein